MFQVPDLGPLSGKSGRPDLKLDLVSRIESPGRIGAPMAVIIPFCRPVPAEIVQADEPHLVVCPVCDVRFDLGDVDQVLDHLHGVPVMLAANDDEPD
jgi:hypothetical protein